MESIIEKIFDGTLVDLEREPIDKDYLKAREDYDEIYEKIDATLNKEQQGMQDELFLRSCNVQRESERVFFEKGFRAGLLLGLELLNKKG